MNKILTLALLLATASPALSRQIYAEAGGTVTGLLLGGAPNEPCPKTLSPSFTATEGSASAASFGTPDGSLQERRGVFEFDLDAWRAQQVSATTFLTFAAATTPQTFGATIPICLSGYAGDGEITTGDVNVSGNSIASLGVMPGQTNAPPFYVPGVPNYFSIDISAYLNALPMTQQFLGIQFASNAEARIDLSNVRLTDYRDVPEPAMIGLFGMGAIGLGLARRRPSRGRA